MLGLADDDSDAEANEVEEQIQKETPLPVSTKPFVVKKFRDALRKADCITGKHYLPTQFQIKSNKNRNFLFQTSEFSSKKPNPIKSLTYR